MWENRKDVKHVFDAGYMLIDEYNVPQEVEINLDELIKMISRHTGLLRSDIEKKIVEKKKALKYLTNDIGAAGACEKKNVS